MSEIKNMRDIIKQIDEQLSFIYGKKDYGKGVDRSILHPPAIERDIDDFEKTTGVRFPPSYKAFLTLHNGWEHFWLNMTLIGVTGKHTERVLAEIKETIEWQTNDLGDVIDDFSPSKIAEWEAEDNRHLYLKNHLCFATNFSGELYVFDKNSLRNDGEMDVVYWDISWGAWENRHPDFTTLLVSIAEEVSVEFNKCSKAKSQKKKKK